MTRAKEVLDELGNCGTDTRILAWFSYYEDVIDKALELLDKVERDKVDLSIYKKKNDYIPTTKRERDLSNYGFNLALDSVPKRYILIERSGINE